MKFSGKMWLMIILKVTKKRSFNPSLKDIFKKIRKGPPLPALLGLKGNFTQKCSLVVYPLEFLLMKSTLPNIQTLL